MQKQSQKILTEILEKYPYLDKKDILNSTEKQLLDFGKKVNDEGIFRNYFQWKKWDEKDARERRKKFLESRK